MSWGRSAGWGRAAPTRGGGALVGAAVVHGHRGGAGPGCLDRGRRRPGVPRPGRGDRHVQPRPQPPRRDRGGPRPDGASHLRRGLRARPQRDLRRGSRRSPRGNRPLPSRRRGPRPTRSRCDWPAPRPGAPGVVCFRGSFHGRTPGGAGGHHVEGGVPDGGSGPAGLTWRRSRVPTSWASPRTRPPTTRSPSSTSSTGTSSPPRRRRAT